MRLYIYGMRVSQFHIKWPSSFQTVINQNLTQLKREAKSKGIEKLAKENAHPCHFFPGTLQHFFGFALATTFTTTCTSNMARSVLTLFLASQLVLAFGAKCVYYGSPTETGEWTANEESFDPMGMTCAALPHFPFGTLLRVTNQINGRTITVRVNDRFGSPPPEETIDLTYGAFGLVANHDDGVVPCSIEVL